MGMKLTGLVSGMDTDAVIKQMTLAYTAKKDKVWKAKETLTYKQDAWKNLNKEVYDMFTKLSKLRLTSTYQRSEASSSNENIVTVAGDKIQGQHDVTVKQIATQTYLTGNIVNQSQPINVSGNLTVTIGGKEKELNITPDMSMEQVARKLTEAGIIANFDENNARLFLASKTTGASSDFNISGDASLLDAIGLGSSAIKQVGKDSIINVNGVDFVSSSNKFNINNMTITAKSLGSATVGMKTDEHIFDTVKSFIKDYNALIKKIDSSYNNTAAKGLSPLTDEEKDALTDKQIEEWESKLKESALSKDETLSSLSSLLKTTMSSISVDGINLTSMGITLGGYFTTEKDERGVYNIDEDKLQKIIAENPDKVINFVTKLAGTLYDKLNTKMKSSSLNSIYSIYNDKQIKNNLANYDKKIAEWEDKIVKMEDKWYKQFARMESVLSKTQSQANYLSNFFGI